MTGTITISDDDGRRVATVTVRRGISDARRNRLATEIAAYLAEPRRRRPRGGCASADRTPRSGIVI